MSLSNETTNPCGVKAFYLFLAKLINLKKKKNIIEGFKKMKRGISVLHFDGKIM